MEEKSLRKRLKEYALADLECAQVHFSKGDTVSVKKGERFLRRAKNYLGEYLFHESKSKFYDPEIARIFHSVENRYDLALFSVNLE